MDSSGVIKFDKSSLSKALKERQIDKGTYDSPCMSVCNFSDINDLCQTCYMYKKEKTEWKIANKERKAEMSKVFKQRIEQKGLQGS